MIQTIILGMSRIERSGEGIYVLASLEALLEVLKTESFPVGGIIIACIRR
jgi:hypothetical protein